MAEVLLVAWISLLNQCFHTKFTWFDSRNTKKVVLENLKKYLLLIRNSLKFYSALLPLSDPIAHYVFSQWHRISPSALDLIIVYHSRRKKFKYFRPRPQNSNIFGGKGNDTTTLRHFFKLKLPIFTHFLDKFFDYETL